MLEEWATQYLILEPGRAFLVGFGLLIVGGLASAFVSRPLDAMARGPYVANLSPVVLGLVLAQGAMAFAPQAISGGYARALALASMLASIIGGFFFGRLAMARSRSAYGHAKVAPLAFLPVATDQVVTLAKAEVCRNGNLRPLLDAGATLDDDYTERGGARFMTITTTRRDCGP